MKYATVTVLFYILLISPIFGWVLGLSTTLDEKRKLAALPQLSSHAFLDPAYYHGIELYFNDHFAFRTTLVKTKNWIDYHIFKTSPSPRVHIGTDGWLYYRVTLRDYLKYDDCNPLERTRMRRIARSLSLLEQLIERSGRQFVFVIAPDKPTVYPEYFGIERQAVLCDKNRYDLFLESLHEFPVKNFVRLDTLLLADKVNHQLYYKTDSHWTEQAGKIAGQAILNHLSPDAWSRHFPRVTFSQKLYKGDLSSMLSLDINETVDAIQTIQYPFPVDRRELGVYISGYRYQFTAVNATPGTYLPKAIWYRDSFSTAILPYLENSFESLDVIWPHDVQTFLTPDPVEELRGSHIVILEIVERYLPGLQIDLRAWKKALS